MDEIHRRELSTHATVNHPRSASACRWATPTLFLGLPFWLEADDAPWSCLRDAVPRVLDSTAECAACVRWEPRRRGL